MCEDITLSKRAESRLAAFADLDHRLSAAKTPPEAARTIVEVADHFIVCDACLCALYSSAENMVSHVLSVDLVGGRRSEHSATTANFLAPSSLARRAMDEGGLLLLRNKNDVPGMEVVPFGDVQRLSASILYVPIRNGAAVIGFLSIQSYTPNAHDVQDLQELQSLADRCGGAMERIRREDCLRQTQEQLRHSQKLEASPQPLNLNEVISNTTKMLKRLIGENVQLQCNYAGAEVWNLTVLPYHWEDSAGSAHRPGL